MNSVNGMQVNLSFFLLLTFLSPLYDLNTYAEYHWYNIFMWCIISQVINAGSIGADGFVDQPEESTASIELNDTQISILENEQLFYATRVKILPSDGPVAFRNRDMIKVEPVLDIEVHMNPEDE